METEIRLAQDFSKQLAALEAENTRLRTTLANIAGVAAGRSADPLLPVEARDSFTWIDGHAWGALHKEGEQQ